MHLHSPLPENGLQLRHRLIAPNPEGHRRACGVRYGLRRQESLVALPRPSPRTCTYCSSSSARGHYPGNLVTPLRPARFRGLPMTIASGVFEIASIRCANCRSVRAIARQAPHLRGAKPAGQLRLVTRLVTPRLLEKPKLKESPRGFPKQGGARSTHIFLNPVKRLTPRLPAIVYCHLTVHRSMSRREAS